MVGARESCIQNVSWSHRAQKRVFLVWSGTRARTGPAAVCQRASLYNLERGPFFWLQGKSHVLCTCTCGRMPGCVCTKIHHHHPKWHLSQLALLRGARVTERMYIHTHAWHAHICPSTVVFIHFFIISSFVVSSHLEFWMKKFMSTWSYPIFSISAKFGDAG